MREIVWHRNKCVIFIIKDIKNTKDAYDMKDTSV